MDKPLTKKELKATMIFTLCMFSAFVLFGLFVFFVSTQTTPYIPPEKIVTEHFWDEGYLNNAKQSFEIAEKYYKNGDMNNFQKWYKSGLDSLNHIQGLR